ncbi:MAG: DUF4349 domain-containing protein [Oscillospiraceae bacterium]|jgi:hypothetical protein|nr:DUF4349 domain-containing protein [Oscillospiraceae bacterium]
MTCKAFLLLLPAYPDAPERPEERAEFLAHAQACPDCAKALREHEQLLADLRALDAGVVPPEAFADGWRAAIRKEQPARRPRFARFQGAAVAAAAALMILTGSAMLRGGWLSPEVADPQVLLSAPAPMAMSADMQAAAPEEVRDEASRAANELIVFTANVTLESDALDADVAQVSALAAQAGGWTEHWVIAEHPQNSPLRTATLTVRVPAQALNPFIESLSRMERATLQEMAMKDMTQAREDAEASLSLYEDQKETLLGLQEQAITVGDTLTLQERLIEVQTRIDELQAQLTNWDSLAEYATVQVDLIETAAPVPTKAPLAERAGDAMTKSLQSARGVLDDVLIALVMAAPYLFCAAGLTLLGFGIWWLRRRIRHKRK